MRTAHSSQTFSFSSGGRRGQGTILPVVFGLMILGFYFLLWAQRTEFTPPLFSGYIIATLCYLATFAEVKIGLTLMMLAIGLSPEIGSGSMADLRIEDAIIPAVFLAWITRLVSRREDLYSTPLKGPIFGYLLMALLSTLMGITFRNTHIDRAAIHYLKTIEYYMMFLIVLNNVRTLQDAKLLIGMMVVASFASGFYGLSSAQQLHAEDRLAGPGGESANILGGYYAFNMVLVCALATTARSWLKRLLIIGALLFLGFPLLRTASRASLLSMLLGLGAIVFISLSLSGRKRAASSSGILVALLLLFVILPGLMPGPVRERFATILSLLPGSREPLPSSVIAKTGSWVQVYHQQFLTSPLFGFGLGHFALAHVDNEYVKVIVEVGLLGFVFFAAILIRMFQVGLKVYQTTDDPLYRGYSLGYLGALTALCTHAMAATSMTTIRTMEPLMFSSGIMSAIYYMEVIRPEKDKGKKRHARSPEDRHRAYLHKSWRERQ